MISNNFRIRGYNTFTLNSEKCKAVKWRKLVYWKRITKLKNIYNKNENTHAFKKNIYIYSERSFFDNSIIFYSKIVMGKYHISYSELFNLGNCI